MFLFFGRFLAQKFPYCFFFFYETFLSVMAKGFPDVGHISLREDIWTFYEGMIHRGCRPCRPYLKLIFLHALNI